MTCEKDYSIPEEVLKQICEEGFDALDVNPKNGTDLPVIHNPYQISAMASQGTMILCLDIQFFI